MTSPSNPDPHANQAMPSEQVRQPSADDFLTPQPSPALRAALGEYPVWVEVPVQWGDQDAFGHVNNVVFFRWIETSRIAYAERIGLLPSQQNGLNDEVAVSAAATAKQRAAEGAEAEAGRNASLGAGLILAAVACDYRRQVTFPDSLVIAARVQQIGNSSLKMQHLLFSRQQQAVVAEGHATVVFFDYGAGRSRPLPQRIRAAIARLEGSKFG